MPFYNRAKHERALARIAKLEIELGMREPPTPGVAMLASITSGKWQRAVLEQKARNYTSPRVTS